ncbi:MarR family winged helix-turn-helix transcriptional regulator [Dyella sp. KRB-257]|uniref:MarR family winged helix-turn-helix transcriptional regulator n=1 Tax=Dyella sp. KRB-257 TaxID=3400915 RepID=UPI003BFCC244
MPLKHDAFYAFTAALQPTKKAWHSVAGSVLTASGLSISLATPVLLVSRMGDGVPQHVLADRIGVHPAALLRTLDQAQRANLLERREVVGNRRIRAVHLLPEGCRLAQVMESALKALRCTLLEDIPREDIATATRVLQAFENRANLFAQQERTNSK